MMNIDNPLMVTVEQNLKLIEEFTLEEFTTAIKHMHPDKASGPDGLSPVVFQRFKVVMRQEVFKQCAEWLKLKRPPWDLNCIIVVLISKKKTASCMKDL